MINLLNNYEGLNRQISSRIIGTHRNFEDLISKFSSSEEKVVILLLLIEDKIESQLINRRIRNHFAFVKITDEYEIDELFKYLSIQNLDSFRDLVIGKLLQLSNNLYYSQREKFLQSIVSISNEKSFPKIVSDLYNYYKSKSGDFQWTDFNNDINQFSSVIKKEIIAVSSEIYEKLDDLVREQNNLRNLTEQKKHILRHQLIEIFRNNQNILFLLLEKIMGDFQEIEDDVVSILISTIDVKDLKYVKKIAENNDDKNVRLLAEIVHSNLDGTFSKELIPSKGFSNISQTVAFYENMLSSRGKAYKGRTWLRDELIEQIIHDAYTQTDQDFSEYYVDQAGKLEISLTEKFVSILEDNFAPVKASIRKWSEKIKTNKVTVKFSYRDVQKQEKNWQSDIAFLVDCSINQKFMRKHGILIQCKQMNLTKAGRFQKSWKIDIKQCEDLVKLSPFSYYFLYGPSALPRINTLVIPATTVKGIIEANTKSKQKYKNISYEDVRPNSRSLADFMLYDFIGCWNGDSSNNITSFIEGSRNIRPISRFLVKISISINDTEGNR